MFFKKPKKKSRSNPNVSTVNWIIAGIVLFAILSNMGKGHFLPAGNSPEKLKESIVQAAPKAPIDFSNYKNILLPVYSSPLRIEDIRPGEGPPAVCGQKATIAYDAFQNDDKPIGDSTSKDDPLTFRVGDNKVMPALEEGIIGMKKGGRRILLASADMAYDSKGFSRKDVPENMQVRFEVDLLDIKPALPDPNDTPYRIADVQKGTGPMILCGQAAKVYITVWGMDGKKLFSSQQENKALSFTPGKSEVIMGLEQGVIGMSSGGMRTLIIPPSFQKTMDGNSPEITIPLPSNQTVLVDVEAMQ